MNGSLNHSMNNLVTKIFKINLIEILIVKNKYFSKHKQLILSFHITLIFQNIILKVA